jgi:hypothetical protein
MDNIINSFTPARENKYTAILPFITTSKIKIDGTMEANKYMEVIMTIASKYPKFILNM